MDSVRDKAWEKIINQERIYRELSRDGLVYLDAKQLKEIGNYEPRLLAYTDSIKSRPEVFKKNKNRIAEELSLLPIKNGKYLLFVDPKLSLYHEFSKIPPDSRKIERFTTKTSISVFDTLPQVLSTESQALDVAHLSGLLSVKLVSSEELTLTVRGRQRSGDFLFNLPNSHTVNVSGVQLELDSGYESASNIVLIEAKLGRRDDFNIRQLYYPFLHWKQKTAKKISPIFLAYSNGIYSITLFKFGTSIEEASEEWTKHFVLDENPTLKANWRYILKLPIIDPPQVPFPQADDADKVIDLSNECAIHPLTKSEISSYFGFDDRQADYYGNAAIYLGLLRKRRGGPFEATPLGAELSKTPERKERVRIFIEAMSSSPILKKALKYLDEISFDSSRINQVKVERIVSEASGVSDSTITRRAQTVKSWLRWITLNSDIE